jgi:hypothetical protein
MPYDPNQGLPPRDRAFVEALLERFLRSRLAKVGARTLQGHLIGKLLAEAEARGVAWSNLVAGRLPVTIAAARKTFGLTLADERAIQYSRLHAAQYVTEFSDGLREQLGAAITTAVEQKAPPLQLAQALFHQAGEANHDWRRIALTESNIAVSNGYLTSLAPGTVVVGDSSEDACAWCKEHLHGRAFTLLEAAPEGEITPELSARFVWPGKTNVGRSRYPTTADGRTRDPSEVWHPCVPAHPNCRCRWRRLVEAAEQITPGTNRVEPKSSLSL